jgi:alpha-L-fucosidase 2
MTPNVTCLDNVPGAIQVRNTAPGATGMLYEILINVEAYPSSAVVTCVPQSSSPNANATITISGATDAWITWVGDTDFLQTAANFTFQGPDPHLDLVSILTDVSGSGQSSPVEHHAQLMEQYLQDYHALVTPLQLSLGPTLERDEIQPVDVAKAAYLTDIGNAWLEWVLFNYGRYMLVTSARGSLPSNLQGIWADGATNAWSAGEKICDC